MKKLLLLSSIVLIVISCRKNSFITGKNAMIRFSVDTVFFDTVFATTGSITEMVKIFNGNDQKLRLTDIKLMGGSQSSFSINVDGAAGPERDNIEVDAGDSLYVFVAVRINQTQANLPFVVTDSIQVAFNGNQQFIQLQAWGQNAHFLRNQVLTGTTTWDNSLPYVILGALRVDTTALLTIAAGCKIYLHGDASFLVDGSLQVNGDHFDSTRVYFQGDRLDYPYNAYPGSWPGIYFRETSQNDLLKYAVIRNAYQAVVVQSPPAGILPKVVLDQCIIDNSADAGILGLQGSLQATNCLISNCGKNIELGGGGNYQFTFCTAASYSNSFITHTQPVLSVADTISESGIPLTGDIQAVFTNCIFWGDNGTVDNEVAVSHEGSGVFAVNFVNSLWKVRAAPALPGLTATGMIVNMDPLFDSVDNAGSYYNFRLQAGSPAIGQGAVSTILADLDGKVRPATGSDLGCYQQK
jgi:hypothetical protein